MSEYCRLCGTRLDRMLGDDRAGVEFAAPTGTITVCYHCSRLEFPELLNVHRRAVFYGYAVWQGGTEWARTVTEPVDTDAKLCDNCWYCDGCSIDSLICRLNWTYTDSHKTCNKWSD